MVWKIDQTIFKLQEGRPTKQKSKSGVSKDIRLKDFLSFEGKSYTNTLIKGP